MLEVVVGVGEVVVVLCMMFVLESGCWVLVGYVEVGVE